MPVCFWDLSWHWFSMGSFFFLHFIFLELCIMYLILMKWLFSLLKKKKIIVCTWVQSILTFFSFNDIVYFNTVSCVILLFILFDYCSSSFRRKIRPSYFLRSWTSGGEIGETKLQGCFSPLQGVDRDPILKAFWGGRRCLELGGGGQRFQSLSLWCPDVGPIAPPLALLCQSMVVWAVVSTSLSLIRIL